MQPVDVTVYVIVVFPAVTPVMVAGDEDAGLTVAVADEAELQVPPAVASDIVVAPPSQTV